MKNSTKGIICTFAGVALIYLAAWVINHNFTWYYGATFIVVALSVFVCFIAAANYFGRN